MLEISLMEEFPNISVVLMADGPEDISFPYFCQCMDFVVLFAPQRVKHWELLILSTFRNSLWLQMFDGP